MADLEGYRAKRREQKRLYRQRYPEKRAEEKWRARFGISAVDYKRLMAAQGGCCAICGSRNSISDGRGGSRRLAVDHCHATGRIRGLLCHSCNAAIGLMRDDPDRIARAAEYVRVERGDAMGAGDFGPWGIEGCVGDVN